jgi:pyruvate formate lyase activating enzyme
MTEWVVSELGEDVPMHFTAFHSDYRMLDRPATPPETLQWARRIALESGVRHAYTGNVRDRAGQSTYCHACGAVLIGRDGYTLAEWNLTPAGACRACGTRLAGVFDGPPGDWGGRRLPVRLGAAGAGA